MIHACTFEAYVGGDSWANKRKRPRHEDGKAKEMDSSRADVQVVVQRGGPAAEAIESLGRTMDEYSRWVVNSGVIEEGNEDCDEEDDVGIGEVGGP